MYGDFEMIGRLIPSIFVNLLTDKPINLSSPHCVRDFIYIKDIVDFYIELSQKKPAGSYVFNAGTGVQTSIKELIDVVQSLTDNKVMVNWGQQMPRPWEPKTWKASIDRARKEIGWDPKYSLKAGLSETLEWFEKNLHLYNQKKIGNGKKIETRYKSKHG